MKCSDCGKQVKSIFRDGNEWFYEECNTCHDIVCGDCSDIDDGIVECLCCIETRLIRESERIK